MKGLFIKDLYMMRKYMLFYMFIILIFFAVSFLGESTNFFVQYALLMISAMCVSLASYDERFHWDTYCDTMPVSRACVVSERYLLNLALILIMLPVMLLAHLLQPYSLSQDVVFLLLLSLSLGLGIPSFMYPVTFSLGTEKGRLAFYALIFVVMAVAGVTVVLSQDLASFSLPHSLPAALCLLPIAVYAISWLLSIRLYQNRSL